MTAHTNSYTGKLVPSFLAVLFAALAACSDAPPGAATPTAAPCENQNECQGGQTCDLVKKVCVAKAAPDGFSVDSTVQNDGGGSEVADSTTAPDQAADQADPSDTGPGKDATTADVGPVDSSCLSCSKVGNDAECGGGAMQCIDLLNGTFCARKCEKDGDCHTGYVCEVASSGVKQKHCVLPTFQCDGCAGKTCAAGQKCNLKLSPPACKPVKAQCEDCNLDADCDGGLRCVKQGTSKVCAPDCSNGNTCPDKSTCQGFLGVAGKACAFQAAKCCYGSACTVGCTGCAGDKCIGGKCVACTVDADCKGGKCNVGTHECMTNATCPAEAPIKLSATGACVECTNDTHCASKAVTKCNASANKCEKPTGTNECASCGGNYPGCVEINGTWSCVECVTDKDCETKKAGTCSATKYTCSGTVGPGTGKLTGNCKTDADCANGPSTKFDLACDAGTGLCYDKNGECDNVVAFCNAAAGSNCKPAESLIPGGIPGLPGGGSTTGVNGVCTCGATSSGGPAATMDPICEAIKSFLPSLKNCDCSKDPKAADCNPDDITKPGQKKECCVTGSSGGAGDPFSLITCLLKSQQPGSASPACFGGACSDLSCLAALSGGSASSGMGGSCKKGP